MRRMEYFNPPPGWPPTPHAWRPSQGWQPDPRWPDAPADWPFWVDESRRPVAGPEGLYGAESSPSWRDARERIGGALRSLDANTAEARRAAASTAAEATRTARNTAANLRQRYENRGGRRPGPNCSRANAARDANPGSQPAAVDPTLLAPSDTKWGYGGGLVDGVNRQPNGPSEKGRNGRRWSRPCLIARRAVQWRLRRQFESVSLRVIGYDNRHSVERGAISDNPHDEHRRQHGEHGRDQPGTRYLGQHAFPNNTRHPAGRDNAINSTDSQRNARDQRAHCTRGAAKDGRARHPRRRTHWLRQLQQL